MRNLVILGGGTGGTIAANRLRRRLDVHAWTVTVVDQDDDHIYQPGLLLLPFGGYDVKDLVRPRGHYLTDGVDLVLADIDRVDAESGQVRLAGGRTLDYDYLVIATGTSPRPDQTPGMLGAE